MTAARLARGRPSLAEKGVSSMLEARITAPRGSLYYAADATPYDLETLRQHLREYCPARGGEDVTLELTVDDGPAGPIVAEWLRGVLAAGLHIRVQRHRRGENAA
jgi:hypothetical protein